MRFSRICSSACLVTVVSLVTPACSGDETSTNDGIGGASGGLGGAPATGVGGSLGLSGAGTPVGGRAGGSGSRVVGGQSSQGSESSAGGTNAGGATSATASAGGASTKGGATSTGGTSSSGGTSSKGGSANGGSAPKGGATSSAGASSTGGNTTTGTTPVTVWIAGDSTVANGGTACPNGWGGQFASYFNTHVTVKNNAAGGRSIQTWMFEPNVKTTMGSNGECVVTETNSARWAETLAGMKAGDYLFIQFGINDGSATCDRHVGSARYQALMTRMAQAALDRGAHPVLLTAVGMIKCSGSTAVASRGFLTETRAAGTALKVPVIDLHQLSTALYNTLKFCPLPAGNSDISASTGGAVGAFFCNDHTHFDKSGALQIAGVVAKALRDQSVPLAAYLK